MNKLKRRILDDLRAHPDSTASEIADRLCPHWWQLRRSVDARLAELQRDEWVKSFWAERDRHQTRIFRIAPWLEGNWTR